MSLTRHLPVTAKPSSSQVKSVANSGSRSLCLHAFDGGKILDVKLHKLWEDKKFPNFMHEKW
jgi:hypothetical protein